ncbi:hypothetical protein Cni_G07629 [Canna indica]|uniref:Citrate transporter-like domain-containing protein n=1 Tax=Canna indica TaxID=4628 RepID=A0AAQ3Q7I8_9LILI|nr:hypothetical protein Cni_G07629 [Canna indica]
MALASVPEVVMGSIAFTVFWMLAVFPAVPLLPIGRTAGSLLGAMLMVIFQVLSPDQAYASIDLPILGLLFGTMVVSIYLERAQMFKYLGKLLAWRSKGGRDLLVRVCLVSALASALFTNDTTCIVLTEFVLKLAKQHKLPAKPFLLALATSANIGSSATPIGNPQNLVIAVESKISFVKFFVGVLPAMLVGVVINIVLLLGMFWKQLSTTNQVEQQGQQGELVDDDDEVEGHTFSPARMSHPSPPSSQEKTCANDVEKNIAAGCYRVSNMKREKGGRVIAVAREGFGHGQMAFEKMMVLGSVGTLQSLCTDQALSRWRYLVIGLLLLLYPSEWVSITFLSSYDIFYASLKKWVPRCLFFISMSQDVVLEHFQGRMRPKYATTSSVSHRNIQDRVRKEQSTGYHYLEMPNGDLRELSRSYSSCLHYESTHSRTFRGNSDNEVIKRGSMYQSSKEVRRMRKLQEGRRTKESGCRDQDFISFEIVDYPHGHDTNKANQLQHQKFLPPISSSACSKPTVDATNSVATSSTRFLDLSFRDLPDKSLNDNKSSTDFVSAKVDSLAIWSPTVDARTHYRKPASKLLESGSQEEQKSQCHKMVGCERDSLKTLPKCFSENAKMTHRVSQSGYGLTEEKGPKAMLSPLKRMFHPIMKSKSLRDSPLSRTKSGGNIVIDPTKKSNGVLQKSLLREFPIIEQNIEHGLCSKGGEFSTAAMSPAHLRGILNMKIENENPSFRFSLQDPEDVLSAKKWRTNNAFNWVYTFHRSEKKMNSGGGTKHKHEEYLPLVGQMQISCYLCSEVSENGSLANSTVTEFVLYDIARGRMNSTLEERPKYSLDSIQLVTNSSMGDLVTEGHLERKHSVEHPDPARHGFSSGDSNASTSYPWLPENLHPQLEIAAVEIQIPFIKKQSWKHTIEFGSKEHTFDMGNESKNNLNHATVKVVTPSGAHGLPNNEESCPSSLLDRWRLGGGCDCGGWDMACPIIVFSNSHPDNSIDHTAWENQKPISLFEQGSKENVPSLSITADGKEEYSVEFHAHFSSLQAFSICIAILHSSDVSSAIIQGKRKQSLYSNSLKLLLEEEVRHLIEAVTTEEKRKSKRGVEQVHPFFIDPPFSPMGRV